MKNTGIIRRIDDLGRVVIPKEIRRTLFMREGDPLEIYTGKNGEVIFKKHSPLGEVGYFTEKYAKTLNQTSGFSVIVCDREKVTALAGISSKEYIGRRISEDLERHMAARHIYAYRADGTKTLIPFDGADLYCVASAPVITSGDLYGSISLLSKGEPINASETEISLVVTAANFISKVMEA